MFTISYSRLTLVVTLTPVILDVTADFEHVPGLGYGSHMEKKRYMTAFFS